MATDICKRWTIAVVFIVPSLMKIACIDITDIPGLTTPDDVHACVWFTGHDGSSIYRCCDGYYKTNATDPTGKCIECPSGLYGFFCKQSCNCENGGTCNTVDGSCRCSALYFGNKCQYPSNCQNGATCMHDGRCMCADGFYGELCKLKCSCPENSKCNTETGECLCHDGFYGNSCLSCNCSGTEQCDIFSGACTCRPRYYGKSCDKLCSCFNGAYCGNDQANKCKCPSGWVGSQCTDCDTGIVQSSGLSFCDNKCLHCYNGNGCSLENGDCLCSPGWQGNRCDQKCEPDFYGNNCSEVCHCQNGICDHITGICKCESRWTGQHCEEPCPDNCLVCKGHICTSCKPGWTDESCSNSCKPGFHGDSCQQKCTKCNCSTSCHHVNGSCPDVVRCEEIKCKYQNARICMENPFKLECQDGWTGRLCDVEITTTTTKDMTQSDSQGGTLRPTEDGYVAHESYLQSSIVITATVLVPVVVIVTVIFCLILLGKKIPKMKVYEKAPSSDYEKGMQRSVSDEKKSEPYLSTLSAAASTNNINERDSSIGTNVQRTDSKQTPIYASVNKPKKGRKQGNAIKENSQDAEPIQHDALIQSKSTKSTPNDDAILANSSKGPCRLNSSVNFSYNDTEYEMLQGIGAKQYNNSDTDNGAYELLNYPQQT